MKFNLDAFKKFFIRGALISVIMTIVGYITFAIFGGTISLSAIGNPEIRPGMIIFAIGLIMTWTILGWVATSIVEKF